MDFETEARCNCKMPIDFDFPSSYLATVDVPLLKAMKPKETTFDHSRFEQSLQELPAFLINLAEDSKDTEGLSSAKVIFLCIIGAILFIGCIILIWVKKCKKDPSIYDEEFYHKNKLLE